MHGKLLGLQSDPALLLALFAMCDRGDLASATTAGRTDDASPKDNSIIENSNVDADARRGPQQA